MNNYKKLFRTPFYSPILILFLLFLCSCKQDITRSDAYLEVMKIHDVAMAEMGNIHNKSVELKKLLSSAKTDYDSSAYETAIIDLEQAEDGMMEWMQGFQVPKDPKAAKVFLEDQLTKVKKMNNDIFSALEKAENLIKK